MKELNWLSINQLSYYHSVLSIWKIERMGEPKRNYNSIIRGNERNGRIDLTDRIWSIRAQEIYKRMDSSVTGAGKVSQFKKRLKVWISLTYHMKNNLIENITNMRMCLCLSIRHCYLHSQWGYLFKCIFTSQLIYTYMRVYMLQCN